MIVRLRPSIEILRTGPQSFVLWDRERDRQYELGAEERLLLELLQTSPDLDAARRQYQAKFQHSISRRKVAEFVEHLRSQGLLTDETARSADPEEDSLGRSWDLVTARRHGRGLNLFFDVLAGLVGWVFNPLGLILALALIALGLNVLIRNWHEIYLDLREVVMNYPIVPVFVLSFVQTIFLLNLPHAFFRGAAARLFGGRVESVGIYFWRGFVPAVNVNVGLSFWLMKDRDQRRFLTADALFPAVMGAVYLIGWAMSGRHPALQTFFAFMIPSCVVGFLLVQCNPFATHSLYFALCRWLNDWRVRERALAETQAWLGWHRSPEALTGRERFWLRLYGLTYYVCRIGLDVALITVLLVYVVSSREDRDPTVFLFLGAAAFCLFQGWDLGRYFMPERLSWLFRAGGRWYVRWPLRLAVLAGIVACGFIPYTHEVGGDARLMPIHEYTVRAQIPSEVAEVRIKAGDRVSPNSVIAVLYAREQRKNVETTRHELAEAEARLDLAIAGFRQEQVEQALQECEMYRSRVDFQEREFARQEKLYEQKQTTDAKFEQSRYDLDSARRQLAAAEEKLTLLQNGSREEEIRAQQATVDRLQAQLDHYETELKLSDIIAPGEGDLVAVRVPARPGQYVMPGDLIAVLDDISKLRVEVFATEDAAVKVHPEQRVNFRMPGYREGELLTGKVVEKSSSAIHRDEVDVDPYRSDREFLSKARVTRADERYVRIYADLDETPQGLTPYMTGYARIVIGDGLLWEAVARPVVRFARTEIWSWLP